MSDREDAAFKCYEQLCQSYRQIDDFRSKLLGFLPVATGVGIWVLAEQIQKAHQATAEQKSLLGAVGLFGLLITMGLSVYEIYGIRKCKALIDAGKRTEEHLGLQNGQFLARPQNVMRILNEPCAAGIIYSTVIAAWAFFALAFIWPVSNPWVPALILIIGFTGMTAYDYSLRLGAKSEAFTGPV